MNRGSATMATLLFLIPQAFNEAPIHESGKSPKTNVFDMKPCAFNEAPIHESGKYS